MNVKVTQYGVAHSLLRAPPRRDQSCSKSPRLHLAQFEHCLLSFPHNGSSHVHSQGSVGVISPPTSSFCMPGKGGTYTASNCGRGRRLSSLILTGLASNETLARLSVASATSELLVTDCHEVLLESSSWASASSFALFNGG